MGSRGPAPSSTAHRFNGISADNGLAVKSQADKGGFCVPAGNAGLLGTEVHEQILIAILVNVDSVYARWHCPLGAKGEGVGVDLGGIEVRGSENGHRNSAP